MPKLPTLPRIAITATGRTPAALLDAARRALRYTRFVELRLDWVPEPDGVLRALPQLFRNVKAKRPIFLATCRRQPNGGEFQGSVAEQITILERAAALGCRLIDLEIESAEALGPPEKARVAALQEQAALVLSFHDFERTPPLETIARRLRRFPADFYKLVTTATRQSDNCAVLDFLTSRASTSKLKTRQGRWVAFCMGEAGMPSRILALSRGSRFVYAALPLESVQTQIPQESHPLNQAAAPGQLDWDLLTKRYLSHKLTRKTAIYGLIGSPVAQSIGAAIHNAALHSSGLNAVYIPFFVNDLRDFRKAAARYPLAGFSVTIPHKQGVLRSADRADRLTRSVGAANTVRVRAKRWDVTNTDVEGIVAPLRRAFRLGKSKPLPSGFRAVILGNGGAARAAVLALQNLQSNTILVTGRNSLKVRRFARELGVEAIQVEQLERERFDLLVQTTPVGMWPHTGDSPLRPEQINARVVFDLIYNPPVTRLLALARTRGSRTISGLEMFLAQATCQFQYWTKREPPVRLMRQVALEELRRFPAANTAVRGTS